MTEADHCPACGVSLIGEPIPEELRRSGFYGDSTHWRRDIAIYDRDRDQTVAYQCPDCRHVLKVIADGPA